MIKYLDEPLADATLKHLTVSNESFHLWNIPPLHQFFGMYSKSQIEKICK